MKILIALRVGQGAAQRLGSLASHALTPAAHQLCSTSSPVAGYVPSIVSSL